MSYESTHGRHAFDVMAAEESQRDDRRHESQACRERAKRIVDEQPRHSADSLRELLWKEFPEVSEAVVECAIRDALYGSAS